MSNKHQTEVLVVGAGPVGMLTALLLTRNGVETRIIDQHARTARHSYSCALHPNSLSLLNQTGVAGEVIELGRRIYSVAFYEGAERKAEVRLSELPGDFPYALVLEQGILEHLLEENLRQAGVKIEWNHRLGGLETNDFGTVASIEELAMSGKGYGVPDFDLEVKRAHEMQAAFVVGADGANSLVRNRLGIRSERTGPPQHFAVYEMETAGGCGHEARVVLDCGSAVLWPLSDTRCRWSFEIEAEEPGGDFPEKDRGRTILLEPRGEDQNLRRLWSLQAERAPWFQPEVKELLWSADVQFEPRVARQFGRGHCWLAGDAAHQTGPIGMQSMNIGFQDGADLADAITEVLRAGGSTAALRYYGHGRHREWEHLFEFQARGAAIAKASDWVRQRAFRIANSIPASGRDLSRLLEQLGVDFPSIPKPDYTVA